MKELMTKKDVKYLMERNYSVDEIREAYVDLIHEGITSFEERIAELLKRASSEPKVMKLRDDQVTELYMNTVEGRTYTFSVKELSKLRQKKFSDEQIYELFVESMERGHVTKTAIKSCMGALAHRYNIKRQGADKIKPLIFTVPKLKHKKNKYFGKNFTKSYTRKKRPTKAQKKVFMNSPEWRNLRREVFRTYGRVCLKCGDHDPRTCYHIDHIRPISQFWGLRNVFSNLQVLCARCNVQKCTDIADYRSNAPAIKKMIKKKEEKKLTGKPKTILRKANTLGIIQK